MAEQHETGIVHTQSATPLTITVIQVPTEVVRFNVSEPELDGLVTSDPSLHFGFLGLAVGALIAFAIALLTATLGDRMFATFVALTAVSAIASGYFGMRSYKEYKVSQERINRIKARRRPL